MNALAFSENGYYMASAGEDGYARLWDLRKLTNFDNLAIGGEGGGAAHSVAFDFSGSYLAAGGKKCTKVRGGRAGGRGGVFGCLESHREGRSENMACLLCIVRCV